jgi:alkylation response protein AidB-like acyl-CoA dehydrogenase
VNFAFSDEQEEFREMLHRFLEQNSPTTEVFRLMETPEGFDPAVWKQMAEELGLQGVHIPEAHGGQGFGFLELGIVLEETGRCLLCSPYFSTVCLATNAILNAATEEQKAAMLPGIASGDTIATLALLEENGRWDASGIGLAFARDGDAYRLSGSKQLVTDGAAANLIIVAARRPGSTGSEGLALFAVQGDADGLVASPVEPLDATRKLAKLDFSGVHAELLGEEESAAPALAKTLDQACVCLAAESAGGTQQCLD